MVTLAANFFREGSPHRLCPSPGSNRLLLWIDLDRFLLTTVLQLSGGGHIFISLQVAIQVCNASPIDSLAATLASSRTTIKARLLAWYLTQW